MSFFKRLFGLAKNARPEQEVQIDFAVKDLQIGFILEYQLRNWEVTDRTTYLWDNGVKDLEFTISDGREKQYLNYAATDEGLSIYWKEPLNEVWPQAAEKMRRGTGMDTQKIVFNGKTYTYAAEGYAIVQNSVEKFEMRNWLFESEDQEFLLSFNKYEDNSCEVYAGKYIGRHTITNILPRK